MRDGRRVVERIASGPERRPARGVAQDPALLEPRYMAELPQRWIDDGEPRPEEGLRRERRGERAGSPTRISGPPHQRLDHAAGYIRGPREIMYSPASPCPEGVWPDRRQGLGCRVRSGC